MLKLCGFSASNYYNKVKLALLEKQVTFEAGPHPTMPATLRESVRHVPEEVTTEREEEVTYRERLGG